MRADVSVDTSVVIFNFVRADVFAGEKSARTQARESVSQNAKTMNKLFLASTVFLICTISHGQIITTVAGNGTAVFSGDGGQAVLAGVTEPLGVTVDAFGNMYIAEAANSNRIRKVNTAGVITTVAGNGTAGYSGDGGLATAAALNAPFGITVDASGNFYIPDFVNNRIRKVNTSGIITTVAGNGIGGYNGDGGIATVSEIFGPFAVAFDASGNMYISEYNNNRIRMVNTSGIISTFAGNGIAGFGGDGGLATTAQLKNPSGIAFDLAGNLYIADCNNNRIRKVNTAGIITTVAGNGTGGFNGDGGLATSAELFGPDGITLDSVGNLYIADDSNNRIRKVSTTGVISTIAGNGIMGFSGDGGLATSAEIGNPNGICFDNIGNLYIADTDNNRIREVTNVESINDVTVDHLISIYPNPFFTQTILQPAEQLKNATLTVDNCFGQTVAKIKNINGQTITFTRDNLASGLYFARLTQDNQIIATVKLVIVDN